MAEKSNFATRVADINNRQNELEDLFKDLAENVPEIKKLFAHELFRSYPHLEARIRRMEQTLNGIVAEQARITAQLREAKLLVARAEGVPRRGA